MKKTAENFAPVPEAGLAEQKSALREQWNGLQEKYQAALKRAILKTAAFSLLFGANIMSPAQAQSFDTRPRATAAAEKKSKAKESYDAPQIREGLRSDPYERIFVNTDADRPEELFEVSGGGVSSGFISFKELDQVIAEKQGQVKQLQLVHTHPLAAYRLVFQAGEVPVKQIREYQDGRKELPPHPPSMEDFKAQQEMEANYGPRGIATRGRVIDASGDWDYAVEKDSRLLANLKIAAQELTADLKAKLNEKDWEILKKVLEDKEIDPRQISGFLLSQDQSEDPTGAKRKLGKTLQALEQAIYDKYKTDFEAYNDIEVKINDVVLAESPEEQAAAIQDYITLCRGHGINVKYTPIRIIK